MTKFHKKQTGSRLAALFGLLLFLIVNSGCGREADTFSFTEEEPLLAEPETAGVSVLQETGQSEETRILRFIVHICGAVERPGVYELPEGSRVMDAVTAGGGFTAEADRDACNLAAPVTDGCRIYIMTEEESTLAGSDGMQNGLPPVSTVDGTADSSGKNGVSADGRVNLNTADAAVLQTLPGIGASRAAAILDWRREHGRFERIEDIMKISGIKQAAFDKIKDKITV